MVHVLRVKTFWSSRLQLINLQWFLLLEKTLKDILYNSSYEKDTPQRNDGVDHTFAGRPQEEGMMQLKEQTMPRCRLEGGE